MITSQDARRAADDVLSRRAYRDDLEPTAAGRLLARVRDWVAELLFDLFGSAGAGVVGQVLAVLTLVALAGVAALVVRRLRRGGAVQAVARPDAGLSRAALLARADAAREDGDLVTAVRSRYAVVVRDLQARGVLDDRPGTTIGEVARATHVGMPLAADQVRVAGQVVAAVVYGSATPTPADDDAVAAAVAAVAPVAVGR